MKQSFDILTKFSSSIAEEKIQDVEPVANDLANIFVKLFGAIQDTLKQMDEIYKNNILETPVEPEFDVNVLTDSQKITMSEVINLLKYLLKNSQLLKNYEVIKNLMTIFVQETDAKLQINISDKLNPQDNSAIHKTFCDMLAVVTLNTTIKYNDIPVIMEINKDYLAKIKQVKKNNISLPSVKSLEKLLIFLVSDEAPIILITHEEFRNTYKKLKIYKNNLKAILEANSIIKFKVISSNNVKATNNATLFLKAFQLLKKKNPKLSQQALSPTTSFSHINGIINGTVKSKNIKSDLVSEMCRNLVKIATSLNLEKNTEFQDYLKEIKNFYPTNNAIESEFIATLSVQPNERTITNKLPAGNEVVTSGQPKRQLTVFGAEHLLGRPKKKSKTNPEISENISDNSSATDRAEDSQINFMNINSILN